MRLDENIHELVSQLGDPTRANSALDSLLALGRAAVPALAEFLRTSRPSSLSEARMLAVEGLAALKGPEALDALIEVAGRNLADIGDPAVRLGEEIVVSRAARALADFPEPRARQTLFNLLKGKKLLGVAEAFEKTKDPRAMPALVAWLEDDFVAEAAARAILATGQSAVPWLLVALREQDDESRYDSPVSRRYRARLLEALDALAGEKIPKVCERYLEDSAEGVRWQASRSLARHGNTAQKRTALRSLLSLLDSASSGTRADAESVLAENFEIYKDMIDEEILRRRLGGEAAEPVAPRESTLEILLRLYRQADRRNQEIAR